MKSTDVDEYNRLIKTDRGEAILLLSTAYSNEEEEVRAEFIADFKALLEVNDVFARFLDIIKIKCRQFLEKF